MARFTNIFTNPNASLDQEAERRRMRAEALMQRSMTPQQHPQGRIVANTGLADGITSVMAALASRRYGKQAEQIETESQKRKRLALAKALGVPQPANISVEDPSGGAPYTQTVPRAMTPQQQQQQAAIEGMAPEQLSGELAAAQHRVLNPQQPQYGFQSLGNQLYRTDPRSGTAESIAQGPPDPEKSGIGAVDTSKFSPESVQRFSQTHDYRDLQPIAERDARPLKERLATEEGLRKEFTTVSKDFRELNQRYTNIRTAAQNPSAAGDLAIIFSFMKVLDPTSTVREGEQASAQNATGVPEQVRNVFNRLLTGERLAPEQRADFVNQADQLYKARVGEQGQLIDQYTNIARQAGVNVDAVVLDAFRPQQQTQTRPPAPPRIEDIPGFGDLTPAEQAELRQRLGRGR